MSAKLINWTPKTPVGHVGRELDHVWNKVVHEDSAPGCVLGEFGVGTCSPQASVHVLESAGGNSDLLRLTNNGGIQVVLEDTTADTWDFGQTNAGFRITKDGSGGTELNIAPNGTVTMGPGASTHFTLDAATGDLTIQGDVTASNDVIADQAVLQASAPTLDTHAARKDYVDGVFVATIPAEVALGVNTVGTVTTGTTTGLTWSQFPDTGLTKIILPSVYLPDSWRTIVAAESHRIGVAYIFVAPTASQQFQVRTKVKGFALNADMTTEGSQDAQTITSSSTANGLSVVFTASNWFTMTTSTLTVQGSIERVGDNVNDTGASFRLVSAVYILSPF